MQPYGKRKIRGYGDETAISWCRCCSGKYARIGSGKKWRARTRSLKKRARLDGKRKCNEL